MQSKAATVTQYLAELPPDRRADIQAVRQVILKNLDKDYEEGMTYGMIGYFVPHRIYPNGCHCDPKMPLPFANLASQKNHMALYLMCLYGENELVRWFRQEWEKTGKKLDMGKACIRFNRLDDIPLNLIGETIRRAPARKYIEQIEKAFAANRRERAAQKKPAARPKPAARAKKKSAR